MAQEIGIPWGACPILNLKPGTGILSIGYDETVIMGKGSENPRDIWKFDPPVGRTDPDESAPGPPRVVTYRGANEKYKGRVLHLEKDDKGSRISVREKDDSINQKWFTTNGDSQNKTYHIASALDNNLLIGVSESGVCAVEANPDTVEKYWVIKESQ